VCVLFYSIAQKFPNTYYIFLQQEVFRAKKKRDRKSRHGGDTGLDDERLEAELSTIRRPQLSDTLPCLIFRFAVRVIAGIPSSVRLVLELYHEWQTAEEQPNDEPGNTAHVTCYFIFIFFSFPLQFIAPSLKMSVALNGLLPWGISPALGVLHQHWWKGVAPLPLGAMALALCFLVIHGLHALCTADMPTAVHGQESSTCWSSTLRWRRRRRRRRRCADMPLRNYSLTC